MPPGTTTTKHVFVTGGVAFSLGKGLKGLIASSLGALLKACDLRVMQKFGPYRNIDPGTMNLSSTTRFSSPTTGPRPTVQAILHITNEIKQHIPAQQRRGGVMTASRSQLRL